MNSSPANRSTHTVLHSGRLANLRHDLRTSVNAILGYTELIILELANYEKASHPASWSETLELIYSTGEEVQTLITSYFKLEQFRAHKPELDITAYSQDIQFKFEVPLSQIINHCRALHQAKPPTKIANNLQRVERATHHLLDKITQIEESLIELFDRQNLKSQAPKTWLQFPSDSGNMKQALLSPDDTKQNKSNCSPGKAKNVALGPRTITHQGKILVVDDNYDNRCLLSQQLEVNCYEVELCGSGHQALKKLEADSYDLILLDILMPGLDGYQVLQQLKAHPSWQHIPVIMISALDDLNSVIRCIEMGAIDYLAQPYNPILLQARVAACIEKKHLHDQEIIYQTKLAQANQEITSLNQHLQADNQKLQDLNQRLELEMRDRQRRQEAMEFIVAGTASKIGSEFFRTCVLYLAKVLEVRYALIATFTDVTQTQIKTLAFWDGEQWADNYEYEVKNTPCGELVAGETCKYLRDLPITFPHDRALLNLKAQSYLAIPLTDSQGNISGHIAVLDDKPMVDDPTKELILKIFAARAGAELERSQAEMVMKIAQQKSEDLLLNILPKPVVEQLKQGDKASAEYFEETTILFADIVGFTALADRIPPIQLVNLLNQIFSIFDELADGLGLEKIKTIGDAYMVAAGLPIPRNDHAEAIADMALTMQGVIEQMHLERTEIFPIRIGIHSGSVVAGVIGIKKFSYDLWGDTVNVASRMESSGCPGKIQVTSTTYERLKHKYRFEKRGTVAIKGKGDMTTYWLLERAK
jgi:class 3 adenylate cyclase/DNA-binding response OmpR family regulator